ncbi:MAG: 3-keto-5-aminohexanoate cleavage protein [Thermomicrobiales bacterium]
MSARQGKVIITAAITGGIHVPAQSPYLPVTPEQIIDECVKAHAAGAAVCHIHVREPETGRPIPSLQLFRHVAEEVKKRCDVVLCTTTGGAPGQTPAERVGVVSELAPELASCNMGSMNFALFPLADRIKEYKHDWERPFLAGTDENIFSNTFKSMGVFIETMNEQGTRPELEIYDGGMVNNAAYMVNAGILPRPLYIQFVLGIMGGLPATVENLVFLYNQARQLLGDFNWSVAAAGRFQFPIALAAVAMGGNVRVGLEDSVYIGRGELARSNADQVAKMARILRELSLEPATSDEAREILGLKGLSEVRF